MLRLGMLRPDLAANENPSKTGQLSLHQWLNN
jgi:hypothetical protein